MKKALSIILALVFLSASAFAWETWQRSGVVAGGVVADNTTTTITLPQGVGSHSYLWVPTITSSTLAISGSLDGTNFGTIYDEQTNGTTKIAWGVGATTGGLMVELPPINVFRKIKITCGTAQASDRTFILFGR